MDFFYDAITYLREALSGQIEQRFYNNTFSLCFESE